MSYYKDKYLKYRRKINKLKKYGGDTNMLIKDINNPNVTDSELISYFKTKKINIHEKLENKYKDDCLDIKSYGWVGPAPDSKVYRPTDIKSYDWIDVVADSKVYRPTLLKYLIDNGNKEIINKKLIIEDYGDNDTLKSKLSDSNMYKKSCFYNIIRILNMGIDVNSKDKDADDRTPLHLASHMGSDNDILKMLIKRGANVNSKDTRDFTPLHLAMLTGNTKNIDELINNGGNVNIRNLMGKTPVDILNTFKLAYSKDYINKINDLSLQPKIEAEKRKKSIKYIAKWKLKTNLQLTKYQEELILSDFDDDITKWQKYCAILNNNFGIEDLRVIAKFLDIIPYNKNNEKVSEKRYLCAEIAKSDKHKLIKKVIERGASRIRDKIKYINSVSEETKEYWDGLMLFSKNIITQYVQGMTMNAIDYPPIIEKDTINCKLSQELIKNSQSVIDDRITDYKDIIENNMLLPFKLLSGVTNEAPRLDRELSVWRIMKVSHNYNIGDKIYNCLPFSATFVPTFSLLFTSMADKIMKMDTKGYSCCMMKIILPPNFPLFLIAPIFPWDSPEKIPTEIFKSDRITGGPIQYELILQSSILEVTSKRDNWQLTKDLFDREWKMIKDVYNQMDLTEKHGTLEATYGTFEDIKNTKINLITVRPTAILEFDRYDRSNDSIVNIIKPLPSKNYKEEEEREYKTAKNYKDEMYKKYKTASDELIKNINKIKPNKMVNIENNIRVLTYNIRFNIQNLVPPGKDIEVCKNSLECFQNCIELIMKNGPYDIITLQEIT